MKIWVGPTGNTVRGDVMDVSKKGLEDALKLYDPLLYIVWNPKKHLGYGCWELRRRPEKKTLISHGEYCGVNIIEAKYVENGYENHVLDLSFLSYEVLAKIKKMDLWSQIGYDRSNHNKVTNFLNKLDSNFEEHTAKQEQKNYDDLMYNMKQHTSALNTYKQAILSGTNPAELARGWK